MYIIYIASTHKCSTNKQTKKEKKQKAKTKKQTKQTNKKTKNKKTKKQIFLFHGFGCTGIPKTG